MRPTTARRVARSVSDATRFTPTTPHAGSKTSASPLSSSSTTTTSTSSSPNASGRFSRTGGTPPPSSSAPRTTPQQTPIAGETPEQRVARLRAAHQAAKKAQQSSIDVVIAKGRRFFDVAHKGAVLSLIGLTAIAGLMTVYTAADMIMYNKKRKAEFIEAQRKMEADSLEAARLAYMTGKATPEQAQLVEEAIERERVSGESSGSIFSKLPSVIGAPSPVSPSTSESAGGVSEKAAAAWNEAKEEVQEVKKDVQKKGGIGGWFSSKVAKEESNEDETKRFGWERLSEEDDGAGAPFSDIQRAVEDKTAQLKIKAQEALEKEKERERTGGPLDRVGVAEKTEKKKGWLW